MTRSVLLVGAAMLVAVPAQAGGIGGMRSAASNHSAENAASGTRSATAAVGVRARVGAGATIGVGNGIRGAGIGGIRANAGTALAGSVMIAAVTSAFIVNITQNPTIPPSVKQQAQVELAGGVPFISDADLEAALDDAGVDEQTSEAALEAYTDARIDGLRSALAILAVLVVVALFLAQTIPRTPIGQAET